MSKDGYAAKIVIIDDLETKTHREYKEHWAIKEWQKKQKGENQFSISKGFTVSADEFRKIKGERK